ncbi:MAG: hypothetical protein Q9209_006973 [Squamulea sp. 1 TL-2023]
MSADPFVPSPSAKESRTTCTTPPLDTGTVESISREHLDRTQNGTSSRMTINVRDPAIQPSLAPEASIEDNFTCQTSDRDELANSSEPELFVNFRSPSANRVSSLSSSSRSPEIEVAEVEDISQEPGRTRWRTLASAHAPIRTPEDLWASFPYHDRTQNVWEAADELARQFHHRPTEDRALYQELTDWVRQYLEVTKPYPPHWLDMNNEGNGFWVHFVRVMDALCKRSEDREAFENVLASLAALSFRMVDIDYHALENISPDEQVKQELVSFGYLEWLASILSSDESPLWRQLRHIYDYNAVTTISFIAEEVCQSTFNGIALLSQFLHCMLSRARTIPDIIAKIDSIFEIVVRMVDHYQSLPENISDAEDGASSLRQMTLSAAYDFFQATDKILQTFISKQIAALTHDICQTMSCHLSALLGKIVIARGDLATKTIKEKLGLVRRNSIEATPIIIKEAWKFQMFRKCFLEGRMEIRIQGVESMQRELVEIHRLYIQDVHTTQWHPVVQFLSDFIIENKLIDYLVGVESHPRLIRLTGNIVGFLIVTYRYTKAESDKIWDTVKTSQDPGVVGAVLQMLPNCFDISDYPLLLYLVAKLREIPFSAWDTRMTAYADSLFHYTIAKWKALKGGLMDESPYHCCIKLIREASIHSSSAFHKHRSISSFANRTLEILLGVGPSDQDRLRIYQDCIRHIAEHTEFATGSICVINILLRHDPKIDISTLAKDYDLASLAIAEFEYVATHMSQGLQDQRFFDECMTARLELLQNIIIFSPDSLSTDEGWQLWDATVGAKAPSEMARDSALIMLVNATNSLRKRNSYINACISEYLPKLAPQFYTRNILYFVTHIIRHRTFLSQTNQHVDSSQSDASAIDMLWRIALVAPPNTIEGKAIETLVLTYLDSPKAQGAPKAAIERMHVEVVERCVRQLTAAASQLKLFTDGTSSGEDEPMVVVASDEEIRFQRLLFSRSLLILRELFGRIRSHPSYSPVPSAHAQTQSDMEEVNGVPITIRYQPFSGGTTRSMKSIQMGDLEKVQDLMQRIGALTGFAKFTVIVGGQKLNLEDCCGSTLRVTRLHEKGLFLVKKIHGSEGSPDLTQARVLKPLETEVMEYFSEFYQFLSLDEALSIDVLEFLKAFPPNDDVISMIDSKTSLIDDVFPTATPSKALYSMFAYEQCLELSLQNGSPSQDFICHGIQMMAESLTRTASNGVSLITLGENRAVAGLIECLLKFLKAGRTDTSNKVLSDNIPLAERLFALSDLADDTKELSVAVSLAWTNLLLEHHHNEFAGRENVDGVIYGISDLIQWCIQYIKSTKKPMRISGNLMESLLRTHLFPRISETTEEGPISAATPVLHSKTRYNLYSIVSALCNDVGQYHKLLKLVRSLLPQGEGPQAWSWGMAQTAEDYSYDTNWNFERGNAIRSPTGYPGLRNLTNTCYMNSLLTQLFMNIRFRDFMLDADIVDRNHSQRLLAETRTLFGFMQGTALKAVDTQGIADSLINYENTMIDVSVQMDVDEFYNLLFDRWESQILSETGKKTFRSFYGGQLVQQIKSKECPHISEREEPFSAIQCDIQGKTSLTESLSAYVGGEMMEGENKYSCTSCGTACLKDIPNNLIFHLKRFDYDVMTGIRHKINDRFEFPENIDMAPYSVGYLQDPEQPLSPDKFELVGILVHTGTAESGHYYSFIRERPAKHEPGASWVEFNDADVTPFNPLHIPDLCFGGFTEPTGYTATTYSKNWNAYMLFYKRACASDTNPQQEQPLALGLSTRKTLSRDLSMQIMVDNEKFLRKFCFHLLEQDAVLLALEYADQVLSRMKDPVDFEKLLESLTAIARGCPVCCKLVLEWVTDNRNAFRNLLLRCPSPKVRKSFTEMLSRALSYLRDNDPQEYGFNVDSLELKSGNGALPETPHGMLQRFIYSLREFWTVLHVHVRAWDDYFGLLSTVAGFGAPEVFLLLREEFLKLCLEILIIESQGTKRLRVENPHYIQFVRLIEKGRRYSFVKLCELLKILLLKIDLEARSFDSVYHDRVQLNGGKFPLSNTEESYLYYGTDVGRSRPLIYLDKIITADSNPAAVKKVLQLMISAEPRVGHLADIVKTILNGVNIDPAELAGPHLDAALVFCEATPSAQTVKEMITQIANEVDTIGASGGLAHLKFFVRARQIVNPRLPRTLFHRLVLRTVPKWAPPLLMYYDEIVRNQTVEFLKDLIFQYDLPAADGGVDEALEDCARALCEACIKRIQENVIVPQSQVDVKSMGKIRDVVRHCVRTYFSTGTAEDDRIMQEAEEVNDAITALAAEEAEEANSGKQRCRMGS